jgi:hypothetical protein
MRARLSLTLGTLAAGVVMIGPAAARAAIRDLPLHNPGAVLSAPSGAQARAAEPLSPFAPTFGASWAGISNPNVTPPDPNGAIGPSSYVEIINTNLAIYNRTGGLIATGTLGALTGHSQSALSDPMTLWDPNTQRFYYNVWDTVHQTMAWGFSKSTAPTSIPGSFCNYTSSFGYAASEFPDYPKLGQSQGFLLIGVNHYPSATAPLSDRSDLLWIKKPQGSATITTCPAASTFTSGKFTALKNQDGSQSFTPVPAIADDVGENGYVVSSSDIESGTVTGTKITVTVVRPSTTNPAVPTLSSVRSITVPGFNPPATKVPQRGSTRTLDPLDGRLEHAVAAVDPRVGHVVIWTGHTVNSTGNRTEFRWYEVNPIPFATPTLAASGTISSTSLYVFNGAVAPDRTVNPSGAAHGDSIVIGFSTSSSTTLPADQMVSKIGTAAVSPFVLIHQSATADNDFSCTPTCRWGDYGGATSDPAASLTGTHGEVWLTNEAVTSALNTSWNWEGRP